MAYIRLLIAHGLPRFAQQPERGLTAAELWAVEAKMK